MPGLARLCGLTWGGRVEARRVIGEGGKLLHGRGTPQRAIGVRFGLPLCTHLL